MALTEDLSLFFADFATAGTYDGDTAIDAIFDNEFLLQLGMAARNPVALVQTAEVDADPTGKTLVLNGVTYTIRAMQPIDDGALAVLQLTN